MKQHASFQSGKSLDLPTLRRLAWFRYRLRRFLHFSEQATRPYSVTPQQYVLLLGIAGYTGRGWATISELAEFLQESHNAVVGLVQRAVQKQLVRKDQSLDDRRFVRVQLTQRGATVLQKLGSLHYHELKRMQLQMGNALKAPSQFIKAAQGAR